MRRSVRSWLGVVAAVAFVLAPSAHASAMTYVATYGVDGDPCSRVQPCRSFAGALTQTSDGGKIVVLDSGGYGKVVIDKSVALVAPDGVYAGISVFTGAGVVVAAPGGRVRLSGVTITGLGGNTGIEVNTAANATIERTTISDTATAVVFSEGPPGEARLHNVTIVANANGIDARGPWKVVLESVRVIHSGTGLAITSRSWATMVDSVIAFTPSGYAGVSLEAYPVVAGASQGVSLHRSVLSDNTAAIRVAAPGGSSSSSLQLSVSGSVLVRNDQGLNFGTGINGPGVASIDSSVFADNVAFGIGLTDVEAKLTLTNTTVTRNGFGVGQFLPSLIESRGNNTIRNNGTDTFGGPFTPLPGL